MSYIELHEHVWSHPKTIELSRRLQISKTYAVAHLSRLWTWCIRYADDGCISKLSSYQIADAADWAGDAEAFVKALAESGFIDETHDGTFIHDWSDYAGRLVRIRQRDRERKRNPEQFHRKSDGNPTECDGNPEESAGEKTDSSGIAYSLKPIESTIVDSSEKKQRKRFVKPSVVEIRAYCEERDNGIDAQSFFDYNESIGWKVGDKPMKDWRAAVRYWEQRRKEKAEKERAKRGDINYGTV